MLVRPKDVSVTKNVRKCIYFVQIRRYIGTVLLIIPVLYVRKVEGIVSDYINYIYS